MMVQGRVTFLRSADASCSAAFWSRYSLRNFTEFLFQSAHLLEVLEDALGFGFVDDADGESDVDENILPDFGFGSVREIDFFADAAEIDLGAPVSNIWGVKDFNYPARNGETHKVTQRLKPHSG